MQVDWSVNVPMLLTLVLTLAGVVSRFSRLETVVDDLVKSFEAHEKADEKRFDELARADENGRARAHEAANRAQVVYADLSDKLHNLAVDVARSTRRTDHS